MLARSANTIQYQQKQKDGTRVYIKKSNAALIKALAQKEYDQKILKTIDAEERRIRKFLNKYNPNSLLEVYDSMPEQKGIFVTKYELTDEEYAKKKVEVLFDPSENELKTIRKNVKKQINYWRKHEFSIPFIFSNERIRFFQT